MNTKAIYEYKGNITKGVIKKLKLLYKTKAVIKN